MIEELLVLCYRLENVYQELGTGLVVQVMQLQCGLFLRGVYFVNFAKWKFPRRFHPQSHYAIGTWVWFSIIFTKINSTNAAILKFAKYTPLEIQYLVYLPTLCRRICLSLSLPPFLLYLLLSPSLFACLFICYVCLPSTLIALTLYPLDNILLHGHECISCWSHDCHLIQVRSCRVTAHAMQLLLAVQLDMDTEQRCLFIHLFACLYVFVYLFTYSYTNKHLLENWLIHVCTPL